MRLFKISISLIDKVSLYLIQMVWRNVCIYSYKVSSKQIYSLVPVGTKNQIYTDQFYKTIEINLISWYNQGGE